MEVQTSNITEDYLWSAFREGSENAFDLIYGKMFPVLFNYGCRLCQDEEQVKDCIQNIFIEIWQKRGQVKEVHSLKHYFLKIMRRKLHKELENKSVTQNKLLSTGFYIDMGNDLFSYFPDQFNLESGISSATTTLIKESIGKLSNRKKEAILLKFYENLTYEEISAVMGLRDQKYARQLVYRSLDELRKNLKLMQRIDLSICTF